MSFGSWLLEKLCFLDSWLEKKLYFFGSWLWKQLCDFSTWVWSGGLWRWFVGWLPASVAGEAAPRGLGQIVGAKRYV